MKKCFNRGQMETVGPAIEGRADGIVDSSNGKVYTYIRVRPGRSDGYLKFHDDLV